MLYLFVALFAILPLPYTIFFSTNAKRFWIRMLHVLLTVVCFAIIVFSLIELSKLL